jgi:predicted outer membrane lipoprotein
MSEPLQQPTLSYETPPTSISGFGIGTIALQLVGVYYFVHALPAVAMIAGWLGFTRMPFYGAEAIASFIPVALYVIIGVLLIRFAPRVSTWLFRDNAAGVMAGPISPGTGQYIQAIAFSVAGVLLMAAAAPAIITLIWYALMDMGQQFPGMGMMVEPAMKFLLGLALFLQSKGLAQLWHKIRAGGIMAEPPSSPPPPPEPVTSESERG